MKKVIFRGSIIIAVVAAAFWGHRYLKMPERQRQIPTAVVRQGDVVIKSYSRGELRPVRSVTLFAPNLFGTVQVTRLAQAGSFAREKDLIVEFDDSEVLARLEDRQLDLEQTEEQIRKTKAELAITNNQDQVALLRARYAVRRAELEVRRNELISVIDAKKNLLNLEEAKRRLAELQSDIKSRLEQTQADLAVLEQQRKKSLIEVQREQQRLRSTKLLAPISGLVSIQQNRMAGRMFGMQIPDIREGDQLQPGMPVADILDLSEMEVLAKVGELDRANLYEGQEVTIQLDALAEKKFRGRIKSLSGTATANVWSGDPSKKFDVVFAVDMTQLLAGLGAKPEQIRRMMEMAARNRNKPLGGMRTISFIPGGPPGADLEGVAGGTGEVATAAQGGPTGEGRRRGGGRRGEGGATGGSGRNPEGQPSSQDREKMMEAARKALGDRKLEDLSPEQRRELFSKIRQAMRGSNGATAKPGSGQDSLPPELAAVGGRTGMQVTDKELAEAKLPPPPEEESQLEVLIRPGLLADIEIIVEKIPNAIYIPSQAVFEKNGKHVAYVKAGDRFEERSVKILKQSESVMVVASGLKPGEQIALADPTERRSTEKKSQKPAGGAGPMGGAPVGGKG
jgi:hypothetical protein